MKNTTFTMILIVIILACAAVGVTAYASDWYSLPVERWGERLGIEDDQEGEVAAAAFSVAQSDNIKAEIPENFVLPANYTTIEIDVENNLNDFSFTIVGCFAFDISSGQFNVRVYQTELSHYMHYLQIDGYTFDGFTGWTKSSDGSYYECNIPSVNNAVLNAIYTPKTFSVVFMDGVTNEQIQTLTASFGSEVKAPNPVDYSADGLVFTGWEGGDYSNVVRNTTVYSVYAPARYITCIMPDGSEQQIAVAQGSSLADARAPEFEDKDFKYWNNEDGEKIEAAEVTVDYDMTLEAVYGMGMPQWAKTLLIVLGSLIGAGLIITIVVLVVRRKVRRTA